MKTVEFLGKTYKTVPFKDTFLALLPSHPESDSTLLQLVRYHPEGYSLSIVEVPEHWGINEGRYNYIPPYDTYRALRLTENSDYYVALLAPCKFVESPHLLKLDRGGFPKATWVINKEFYRD